MLRPLLGRRLGLMSVRFLSSGPLKIRELVSEHTAKEIEADSEGKLRAKPFPRHFPTLKDLRSDFTSQPQSVEMGSVPRLNYPPACRLS